MAGITFDDLTDKQKHAAYEHFAGLYTRSRVLDALALAERTERAEKDLRGWLKAHAQFFEQYSVIDDEGRTKIGEMLNLMKMDDKEIFARVSKLQDIHKLIGEL